MERGLLMADNHKRSDPIIASKSKSLGSFVKIDSISIDLADANVKSSSSHAAKCEHFSIRGYVSEIRKKNWKVCWPFDSDGDLNKFDQLEDTSVLPPLKTPNFRFWSCQNCVQETGSKSIPEDHGTDIYCCNIGSDSNKTCAQVHSSVSVLLTDCQQGPQSKVVEGKRVEAPTSTVGCGNEQHPSSCSTDKKEGKDEVRPTTIIANENALEDSVSHKMPRLNSVQTEVNPKRMQERHKDDTEALRLEGNGSVEACKPGCESHEDTNVELDITNKNFWNKNGIQTSEAKYQTSAEDNHKESMNAFGTCKRAGMVDKADNATKLQTDACHPLVLDECDYASSENFDKSSGLSRKKSRKVRLLSELVNKGDAKTDCIRIEDSPSNTISNISGAGIVSQGQVSVQENARVGLSDNKRRKFPEEEEQGCLEMSHPKSLNKKLKAFRRDEETTNAIAESVLEEDAVARPSLQADEKSNWNRHENERIPVVGKKKIKKCNDFGTCSSLVPPEDNVPLEAVDKVGNSSKGNATKSVSFTLTYDASTGRGIDQIPFPASEAEGKSGICKRKGKMPKVDNGQASLFPWNGMFRTSPKTREDVEIMHTGHPFHLAEDASAEKGLDLSLNSYLAAERCGKKSIPQSEDGFPSLSTWKDGSCKLDVFMRKNVEANYAANLKPSKSISNAFSGKGGHGELSSKFYTYTMPILNEEKNYTSQIEQGSCSLQQMDISRSRNKEKIVGVQKSSAVPVNRKHSNHKSDKMSQQAAVDDIPMEIVELMAKNQYERCLHDAEHNKNILENTNKARKAQVMDHSYGIGDLRISEETSQKRKPQARNAKNGITTRKNAGPAKQKSVDYSTYMNGKDFGVSHLDQMHCPTGFSALSQAQKKSTRDQFPAAGYSSCSCAQNCKWNGDMMGPGFSHSSLRTLATSNTCQSIPHPKEEAARLWSSGMPVHLPLTYSNPQKCPAQPSNVDMLLRPPGSLHKGNVNGDYDLNLFNLKSTNREKHTEEVGSGSFSRSNAEYSFSCKRHGSEPHQNAMGSFDLYSNETIPAMHLLSLMDAGMRSGAHFNMGGNPKFLKRPFPNDLYSKEYSAPDIGGYKATDTVKLPSSNCCGTNHHSEKSLDLFPMNPGGASTSSFQHSKGFRKATEFMGQGSLSCQKKEKIQNSNAPAQNRGPGSRKAACTGGGLGKNCGTIPVMQKGFLTVSDPMMFPQNCHTIEYPMLKKLEANNGNGAMNPPKSSSMSLMCSINRNPADFSLPEAGNEYMIRGEDLRVRKRINQSGDRNKRRRNRKQTP
ncbi:hypothetical protein ACE6H2_004534 [Prunus campanulata]